MLKYHDPRFRLVCKRTRPGSDKIRDNTTKEAVINNTDDNSANNIWRGYDSGNRNRGGGGRVNGRGGRNPRGGGGNNGRGGRNGGCNPRNNGGGGNANDNSNNSTASRIGDCIVRRMEIVPIHPGNASSPQKATKVRPLLQTYRKGVTVTVTDRSGR